MAKMTNLLQGVYAPLPQSLSDSDSEKEISMEPVCINHNMKNSNSNSNYRQNGSMHMNDDIIKIKRGSVRMGTTRKIAFVFSILLIFLLIVIFLWVLPCSELNTCPVKISNWEFEQEDIELKGNINIVNGLYTQALNLALLYKGSYNNVKSLKNGIISFMGNNGAVAWDFQQEVEPYKMNCSIIDVDNNGNYDCLVTDRRGLKTIETISGQALWHAHSAEEKRPVTDLDLPIKLRDFNSDGVSELLSIYKKESLLLISGKTGKALANINVSSAYCREVGNLKVVHDFIEFDCKNTTKKVSYQIPLSDIRMRYKNSTHKLDVKQIKTEENESVYVSGNRKLIVNNSENCPLCTGNIKLLGDKGNILMDRPYRNSFIMNPKPFSFQASRDNLISLKGHVNGFIVKIWQWVDHYKKLNSNMKIYRRSVPMTNLNETYYLSEITESVVLITFNETNIHVINASVTEINQMCYGDEEVTCQPDHRNQIDSLLVADLDHDNSQELISYYSSYIRNEDMSWHLVSYLKVFRLEGELPKLYESK